MEREGESEIKKNIEGGREKAKESEKEGERKRERERERIWHPTNTKWSTTEKCTDAYAVQHLH